MAADNNTTEFLTKQDETLLTKVDSLDLHCLLLHGETIIGNATLKQIMDLVRYDAVSRINQR
jgi:hypothetical protein